VSDANTDTEISTLSSYIMQPYGHKTNLQACRTTKRNRKNRPHQIRPSALCMPQEIGEPGRDRREATLRRFFFMLVTEYVATLEHVSF